MIIATDDAGNDPSGLAANPFSIPTLPTNGFADFDTNNSFITLIRIFMEQTLS